MKMSCKKVFSMTYFIQINFIKNDLNKNVLNKKRRGRCFIAYVRFSLRIKKCYTVLTHQNQATPTVSFGFGKQTQKEKGKTP